MHAHSHDHVHQPARVLRFSLGATLGYIVLLLIAGARAHSLALIAEAGHNLSDFLALLLSLAAIYIQARPPTSTKTYGYQRAGVLVAFLNSAVLVLLSFWILYEAFERLQRPEPVAGGLMAGVAAAGVVMNGAIAWLLYRSGRDVNIRSAFLHMLGDTLSTAAVIAGGAAILATGRHWIDPAISLGIGAVVLWSALGILRETLNILLEGTPRGMELDRISQVLRTVEGVHDVHDLHVWSLGSESHALSCHITIADIPPSASERILRDVKERLYHHFRIHHTTIQFEHLVCDVAHGCVVPTAVESPHEP
ncbi:MAG: cation transporter [Acidobacteria bacterium]|nr:cation transporter [Acidobacteriota bacterium]